MSPTIKPLATLAPPCNARTWHSTPHPRLPILATACSDKTARIYSLATFEQQSVIRGGHKRSVRSCAWKSSVGAATSVLATGSFDASVGIWRRDEEARRDGALEVDFTKGLAGGGSEGDEEEEDEEWRFAVVLDGHESEIKSVGFSPVGSLLATCSRDKTVWVWEELEEDSFETVAVLAEHEGDVKCIAWHPSEECLASGSYDDHIRVWREDLDDWACCAVLKNHTGTVWWVEFEGVGRVGRVESADTTAVELSEARKEFLECRAKAGPRIISCSDDLSIRVWRKLPKEKSTMPTGSGRMPSIWKNRDFEEEWIEEGRLPQIHERSVYAVSWSRRTGMVASTGSDGKVVVYQERWREVTKDTNGDAPMTNGDSHAGALTEWVVLAELDNAHDVFEVNHICWAPRADPGKKFEDEEVLVTTGDDGEVKVWRLEE